MSGFEPESEKFVPRTSTSVVGCLVSPEAPQATKGVSWPVTNL